MEIIYVWIWKKTWKIKVNITKNKNDLPPNHGKNWSKKDNQKISKVFFILGKVGKVSGLELTDIILNL